MTTRVADQIDDWESAPFDGGYQRLHELAADEFSGVVQSMAAKLCFLNGTAVGLLDGSIADFEDGGTIYHAPSPALPLLALMQERSDEVRAKYYSEDTAMSEVDSTLTDGNFSGYIELSENVLSGDYYVVYQAGRSMAVAYVGNSGTLLTDDEAFERADDEVGIYEVRPVEVDPVEIPEPATSSGDEAGGAGKAGATASDQSSTGEGRAGAGAASTTSASGDEEGAAQTDSSAGTDTGTQTDSSAGTDAGAEVAESGGADGGSARQRTDERDGEDRKSTAAGAGESTVDERGGEAASGDTQRRPASKSSGEPGTEVDRESTGETAQEEPEAAGAPPREATTQQATERSGERSSGRQSPSTQAQTSRRDTSAGQPERTHTDRGRDVGATAASSPGQLEMHSIPSLDPSMTTSESAQAAAEARGSGPGFGSTRQAASTGRDSSEGPRGSGGPSGSPGTAPAESDSGQNGSPEASGGGTARRDSSTQARRQTGDSAGSAEAEGRGGETATDRAERSERVAQLEADLEAAETELEELAADLANAEEERDDLRAERDRLQEERDDLTERLEDLEAERDELEDEHEELREERDDLESEVERLRSQLDQLEEEYGAATDAERRLSRAEALEGTNLFVRYDSKGEATLDSAHNGNASREKVSDNLDLEFHTQFEADNVSVGGTEFEEYLTTTIEYRFVSWVVEDLFYEIRDTGKAGALADLFDAIPRIDRAELDGTVTAEYTEDGQERRTQEAFDVVLRDRMGNALVVANMNDSRQAATDGMMSTLVTAASRVGESNDTLSAACLVTSSFFEPEALETAADATSGGLLSRDKRESFVKLSRKRGYHLCLAEARERKFHLAVPEL